MPRSKVARISTALVRGMRRTGASSDRVWALFVFLAFLALRVWDPTALVILRHNGFDFYQRLVVPDARAPSVVIVDIDEKSLKAVGQWPWPRNTLALMVRRLKAYGVAAVAFDMLFSESDRSSPESVARNKAIPPDIKQRLRGLRSHDVQFAKALSEMPTVLGRAAIVRKNASAVPASGAFAFMGQSPAKFLISSAGMLRNLRSLETSATSAGLISYFPEADGVIRRIPLLMSVGGGIHPALSVELLRIATGSGTIVVKTNNDGVQSLVLQRVVVPTDSQGRMWIRFRPHDPRRYVSAVDVLTGKVDHRLFQGRLVFVGTSAAGLLDLRSTPFDRALPGVEVHALIIENILFKEHLVRPSFLIAIEFFGTLILGLGLIALLPRLGAFRLLLVGFGVMICLAAGVWLAFKYEGLLIDLTFPAVATFSVYASLTFFNYVRVEQSRRQVRNAFSQYLSPVLLDELAKDPSQLKLGGQMREITVLFADVRNFTTLSEKHDAEGLIGFVNEIFTPLGNAVLSHNGTIDKYIGDSVMAYWNAPLDDPQHARNAALAALEMLDRIDALNSQRRDAAGEGEEPLPVRVGIGINTGVCCVGNMGSDDRFDYSVIGDAVNVASRLEQLTKAEGLDVIVGDTTMKYLDDLALVEIGEVTVRGRENAIAAFGLLGGADVKVSPKFKAFEKVYAELHRRTEPLTTDERAVLANACRDFSSLRAGRIIDKWLEPIEADESTP